MEDDLRSRIDFHWRNLLTAPAHALKRGVVIAHLKLASHHVLTLIQGNFTVTVLLEMKEDKQIDQKVFFERFMCQIQDVILIKLKLSVHFIGAGRL